MVGRGEGQIEASRHPHGNHRAIVRAALQVGEVDEAAGAHLGGVGALDHLGEHFVVDVIGQAIGADDHPVAGLQLGGSGLGSTVGWPPIACWSSFLRG